MTSTGFGDEYEAEWRELNRRLIASVLRLRRGRSPEEDEARTLGEEWVRLSLEREERAAAMLRIEEAHREEEKAWDEADARAALEAMFPEEDGEEA